MARQKGIGVRIDEIGRWSEIKLDIIRDYAKQYSLILTNQASPSLYHVYIDAFAGAGYHLKKGSGDLVKGSPVLAVETDPPFREYFFIDLDDDKTDLLRSIFQERKDISILHGDCNEVMFRDVLPKVQYSDYRRGLCLLDPYGLHLKWDLIREIGQMKTIDMFLNFPIMDMNRNVLLWDTQKADAADVGRMELFWGDNSWRDVAYQSEPTLFGPEETKTTNIAVVNAFRDRLKKVAGFKDVPEPLAMRNSQGADVYYLFFASPREIPGKIVSHIFNKYRQGGAR